MIRKMTVLAALLLVLACSKPEKGPEMSAEAQTPGKALVADGAQAAAEEPAPEAARPSPRSIAGRSCAFWVELWVGVQATAAPVDADQIEAGGGRFTMHSTVEDQGSLQFYTCAVEPRGRLDFPYTLVELEIDGAWIDLDTEAIAAIVEDPESVVKKDSPGV